MLLCTGPSMAEVRQRLEPMKRSAEAAERQRQAAVRGVGPSRESRDSVDSPALHASRADGDE